MKYVLGGIGLVLVGFFIYVGALGIESKYIYLLNFIGVIYLTCLIWFVRQLKFAIIALVMLVVSYYNFMGEGLDLFIDQWDMKASFKEDSINRIMLLMFFCQSSTIVWASFIAVLFFSKPPENLELER